MRPRDGTAQAPRRPMALGYAGHRQDSCPHAHRAAVRASASPSARGSAQGGALSVLSLFRFCNQWSVHGVDGRGEIYAQVAIVSRSSSMKGLPFCSRSSCSAYRHQSDSSYKRSHSSGDLCVSSSSLRAAVLLCGFVGSGLGCVIGLREGSKDTYKGECAIVHELVDPGGRACVLCWQPRLDERCAVVTP